MMYIYTADNCPKCDKLKEKLKINKILFQERSADRIKSPIDEIDKEAMEEASFMNMSLPIMVEE